MQDKLIEEVQELTAEGKKPEEEISPEVADLVEKIGEVKKKMQPSDFIKDDEIDPTKMHLLAGLSQKSYGSTYQGTVDPEVARRRHAKNKAARKARRKNR